MVSGVAPAERVGDGHGEEGEEEPARLHRVLRVGVGERDDGEPDGVVSHSQQQQELDGGVALGEDLWLLV